jgi:hypothetical protein
MTWKGGQTRKRRAERARGGARCVCVCFAVLCVASGTTEGGPQRGKKHIYIGKYINLRPINTTNTRDKHQRRFFVRLHAAVRAGWLISLHFHSEWFLLENPMMPLPRQSSRQRRVRSILRPRCVGVGAAARSRAVLVSSPPLLLSSSCWASSSTKPLPCASEQCTCTCTKDSNVTIRITDCAPPFPPKGPRFLTWHF